MADTLSGLDYQDSNPRFNRSKIRLKLGLLAVNPVNRNSFPSISKINNQSMRQEINRLMQQEGLSMIYSQ